MALFDLLSKFDGTTEKASHCCDVEAYCVHVCMGIVVGGFVSNGVHCAVTGAQDGK